MKILYWNLRGLANQPTRLALKNLIQNNEPDIILIAEPWMRFEDLPKNWFLRQNYKPFAMNVRENNIPNL